MTIEQKTEIKKTLIVLLQELEKDNEEIWNTICYTNELVLKNGKMIFSNTIEFETSELLDINK